MSVLKGEMLQLCKDFVKIVEKFYEKGNITYEQYEEMVKLKLEFINKIEGIPEETHN